MNKRLRLTGTVIRAKMEKTVIVEVLNRRPHKKYGKVLTIKKKYYVHTDDVLEQGTIVVIEHTKPISKTKKWKVIEIIDAKSQNKTKIGKKKNK